MDRTRVADLQNPDLDRPLAAHFRVSRQRSSFKTCVKMFEASSLSLNVNCFELGFIEVQQRGITATGDILKKLVEGIPMNDKHPVLVIDAMPNMLLDTES